MPGLVSHFLMRASSVHTTSLNARPYSLLPPSPSLGTPGGANYRPDKPRSYCLRAACVGCHQKYRESRDDVAGVLYLFFRKKVPKNSPADAFAYFVPSNVRNGRLFAGLQANRPRFLPLLAGPSFHGSGIGPGSFAAKGGAGVRRLFYGCLHRTGSQYPAVAPKSGFKPLYAFCRAGFSSRDIGKLSTFHF